MIDMRSAFRGEFLAFVLAVLALIGIVVWAAMHDIRENECKAACHPAAHEVIGGECYCATEGAWEPSRTEVQP